MTKRAATVEVLDVYCNDPEHVKKLLDQFLMAFAISGNMEDVQKAHGFALEMNEMVKREMDQDTNEAMRIVLEVTAHGQAD